MLTNTGSDLSTKLGDWHVLQLKPNGLRIAAGNLARQGYETLMPVRTVLQPSKFGTRSTKRPLFPGYLFFSVAKGQINWRAVANTRGVARVITGAAGQPAQLPTQIVDDLILATSEDGALVNLADYRPGDQVGVISGPFTGWLAKVIASDDAGRVRLLVDVMGRGTQLNISGHDIERSRH